MGGVLEHKDGGTAQVSDKKGTPNQQWRWTRERDQLINVGTGLPLIVHGHGQWWFDHSLGSLWSWENWHRARKKTSIYRGWTTGDGVGVGIAAFGGQVIS